MSMDSFDDSKNSNTKRSASFFARLHFQSKPSIAGQSTACVYSTVLYYVRACVCAFAVDEKYFPEIFVIETERPQSLFLMKIN